MAKSPPITGRTRKKIVETFARLADSSGSEEVKVTYKDLAASSGLSVGTVIRAVQHLADEGLLEIRNGNRRKGKTYLVHRLLAERPSNGATEERAERKDPRGPDSEGTEGWNAQERWARLQEQIDRLEREMAWFRDRGGGRPAVRILHRMPLGREGEELWHVRLWTLPDASDPNAGSGRSWKEKE